jgi:GPR1/FUN34/yaaH family
MANPAPWAVTAFATTSLHVRHAPDPHANDANSLLLAVFAVITFYLGIASLRHDLVLCAIIWLIFIGLVVLSVGAGANNVDITEAGGVIVLIFGGREPAPPTQSGCVTRSQPSANSQPAITSVGQCTPR